MLQGQTFEGMLKLKDQQIQSLSKIALKTLSEQPVQDDKSNVDQLKALDKGIYFYKVLFKICITHNI